MNIPEETSKALLPETNSIVDSLEKIEEKIDIQCFAEHDCRFCHGEGMVRSTTKDEFALCACAAKRMSSGRGPRKIPATSLGFTKGDLDITPPGE